MNPYRDFLNGIYDYLGKKRAFDPSFIYFYCEHRQKKDSPNIIGLTPPNPILIEV